MESKSSFQLLALFFVCFQYLSRRVSNGHHMWPPFFLKDPSVLCKAVWSLKFFFCLCSLLMVSVGLYLLSTFALSSLPYMCLQELHTFRSVLSFFVFRGFHSSVSLQVSGIIHLTLFHPLQYPASLLPAFCSLICCLISVSLALLPHKYCSNLSLDQNQISTLLTRFPLCNDASLFRI